MSTLIMSTGTYRTDTTIDYPSAYIDINDCELYLPDFNLNSAKEHQTSLSQEAHTPQSNFENSLDCMNHSPASNILSSEFMTSSYFHISGATPPVQAPTPDSGSSTSSTSGDTMSVNVSSLMNQDWSSPASSFTLDLMSQEMNKERIFQQPSTHADPTMSVSTADLHMMGSQVTESSLLPYVTESYSTSKDAPQNAFNVDPYLLPSISESTKATVPSATLFDTSSTMHQVSLGYSQADNFSFPYTSSPPLSIPTEPFQRHSITQKIRTSVTERHASQSSPRSNPSSDYMRTKQYRHHSYTESRRRSNVTPPSPALSQKLPVQMTNYNQPETSSYVREIVSPGMMSPQPFKKSNSCGPEISHVKQELRHPMPTASAYEDVVVTSPHNQQLFQAYHDSDALSVGSPSVASSCAYSSATEQLYNSPQRSPPNVSLPNTNIELSSYEQQHAGHASELPDLFEPFSSTLTNASQIPASSTAINQNTAHYSSSFFAKPQSGPVYASSALYSNQMYVPHPTNCPPVAHDSYVTKQQYPYPSFTNRMRKTNSLPSASSLRPSSEGLCAVCGDNAACQHYGVRTCEGCKGFFKRTVQKKSTYVCLANKNCPVDKRRRNRCQFCRFEKCLAVGMVKEVVRTADLKGRRGRLPSKPKGPKDPVAPPSPPVSFITSLVRAHIDTNPATSNTDLSQYRAPGMKPSSPLRSVREETHYFYELLASCLLVVRQWAEKIPGFCNLSQEDQSILIESSFLEIFALRLAYRMEIQEGKFVFCNGLALHRDQLYSAFGDWTDSLLSFACTLSDLNIDLSSFSCLMALSLFQDRPGLRDKRQVEELQALTVASLKEHVSKSPITADRPNFFMKLLSVMPEVTAQATNGSRRLYQHKMDSPDVLSPKCLHKGLDLFIS